jgi:4,5-dihydroxyphthalate decarboxylase
MGNLKLTFACGSYDRIEPLADGTVKPDGIDLTVLKYDEPRELFDRLMQSEDFDLAEMSSTEHIAMTCRGDNPFVALPVFPSKMFRHGFIVVNRRSGISGPKDLEGRRIGVPLYTMSAALWCRGVLRDDYGVDLSNVTWVQGAMEKAGSHGNPNPPSLLRPVKIEINRTGYSLSELLARGDIDATLGALMPEGFGADPDLVRLFPEFKAVERDYYVRTGIHPIMHLVVIRRRVFEQYPWIGCSLFDAFERAKARAWKRLKYTGAQRCMLPWLYSETEDADAIFGGDPWPYGVEKNKATLSKAIDYMWTDHMIVRRPSLDELFVDVAPAPRALSARQA